MSKEKIKRTFWRIIHAVTGHRWQWVETPHPQTVVSAHCPKCDIHRGWSFGLKYQCERDRKERMRKLAIIEAAR